MKRLFEAAILVVLQFLLVGTCYGGVWSEVEMEFTDQGKVAVYDIEVTGQGVLSVQVKDYEPDSTADYWRATIVILGAPGSGASSLCDIAVTNVGTPREKPSGWIWTLCGKSRPACQLQLPLPGSD